MTTAAHCEAILRGYSKRRDKDGDWIEVKFQLHPQEVPQLLNDAGLGTRFMLALAEIGDDETPIENSGGPRISGPDSKGGSQTAGRADMEDSPAKLKGGRRAREAGIACGDEGFQKWLWDDAYDGEIPLDASTATAERIRIHCGVQSRADLDHDELAGHLWDRLYTRYLEETGRRTEKRG